MLHGQISPAAEKPAFGRRIPGVPLPAGHNGGPPLEPSREELFKNWRKGPRVRAEKERKALEELEALWPRRFAGITAAAAKAVWFAALKFAGAWLGRPQTDEATASKPIDPVAALAASVVEVHRLVGVPEIDPDEIHPEQGAWLVVEHGKAGRASTEIRLYTRAPRDALVAAMQHIEDAMRRHGMPVLVRDIWRAPRNQVAAAHVGVLRVIPKPA